MGHQILPSLWFLLAFDIDVCRSVKNCFSNEWTFSFAYCIILPVSTAPVEKLDRKMSKNKKKKLKKKQKRHEKLVEIQLTQMQEVQQEKMQKVRACFKLKTSKNLKLLSLLLLV